MLTVTVWLEQYTGPYTEKWITEPPPHHMKSKLFVRLQYQWSLLRERCFTFAFIFLILLFFFLSMLAEVTSSWTKPTFSKKKSGSLKETGRRHGLFLRYTSICVMENVLRIKLMTFFILIFCRSRESANLEYLKNIVLRFMMSTSYSVKQQMITAIGTILEFSPKEVKPTLLSYTYQLFSS